MRHLCAGGIGIGLLCGIVGCVAVPPGASTHPADPSPPGLAPSGTATPELAEPELGAPVPITPELGPAAPTFPNLPSGALWRGFGSWGNQQSVRKIPSPAQGGRTGTQPSTPGAALTGDVELPTATPAGNRRTLPLQQPRRPRFRVEELPPPK